MRVLQIVPSIALVYGGPSQMVLGLSSALAQQGVDVTIVTTNANGDAGQPPLDVPLRVPVREGDYTVWYFPCSWRRYKFSGELLSWLWQHAGDFDVAHIHALFSPLSTLAAKVARWRGLPYVLRPLGTLDPADLRKKKFLKQLYGWGLERGNLAGAARVHFTTAQEARVSRRFGTNTTDAIVPLGVELPALDPDVAAQPRAFVQQQLQVPSDRPLVLFLSRIEPKKGLDILIPALEELCRRDLDFHLVLAGSNPQDPQYEDNIRRQVEHSVLAERTTMPGFVRGNLKVALLQAADVFALFSYYENFGIAVAEAMAAGTAVAISRGVYIWEEVEQAQAGWVSSADVLAATDVLTQALSHPEECDWRGAKGRVYARQHFSWEAIAASTQQIYQDAITSQTTSQRDRPW
ncbi:hormogonium polysaccharide biosynthesis glycosyltransferase HpsP [Geitlerinema sp. PCC 9228]|jgi:glycosyltransferase involved in cell wall biosynthesis|uniref:hormogonium polysaccharide biosynthesis glycosyltransferase HpsP n=1 Tax=Geitlerinema sp. PCC 9228 TaxID=111611 RepID=UPI0008F9D0A9|nr:hormogonium polysaccharide biosynthesis glycosyltransferase HpsP [Geitlerinema sp. PCC 9228]